MMTGRHDVPICYLDFLAIQLVLLQWYRGNSFGGKSLVVFLVWNEIAEKNKTATETHGKDGKNAQGRGWNEIPLQQATWERDII
jgi:hypothetical protein